MVELWIALGFLIVAIISRISAHLPFCKNNELCREFLPAFKWTSNIMFCLAMIFLSIQIGYWML